MAVALVACGEKEPEVKGPAKDVSLYDSGKGYDEIADPLSWEAINKFPIAKDGMTIEEKTAFINEHLGNMIKGTEKIEPKK